MTKETRKEYPKEAFEYSKDYEFSSFKEYLGEKRQQSSILSEKEVKTLRSSLSD